MRLLKKYAAVAMAFIMCINFAACKKSDDLDKTAKDLKLEQQKTVDVWYCDENYRSYIELAAERFHKANSLVTINPVLVNAEDYLTNIYDESIRNNGGPDVFIMSADELERVQLMGLAAENNTYSRYYTSDNYCDVAIKSARYKDKLYGYPLCFNVAYMVYNSKHVEAVSTFTELTEYNNNFQVTDENQEIKEIVSWDVSDMFLNFGFSAGSINIGGENGDDSSSIQVNSDALKSAMQEYSGLKDTYGIDRSTTTKSSCVSSFIDGSLAYTILDMNSFKDINGSEVEFNITKVPDYNSSTAINTLGDTTIAVVNSYSDDVEVAKAVANALSYDYASFMVESTGRLSAKNIEYTGDKAEKYKTLYDIYRNSTMKAKFIGSTTIYTRYEIMISQIWKGGDIDATVNEFALELTPKE